MAAEYLRRLGDRIRERREELGLTQEDIARQMPGRTNANQVSRWERGQHRPQDDALEQLAVILKTPVTALLTEAPAGAPPSPGEGDDLLSRLSALEQLVAQRLDQLDAKVERALSVLGGDDEAARAFAQAIAAANRELDEVPEKPAAARPPKRSSDRKR